MKNARILTAGLAAALLVPGVAFAQQAEFTGPTTGQWEATLSGSGTSDTDFDNNTIGLTGSIGQYMHPNVLVGLRQTLNYSGTTNDDVFTGSTRLFADYVFAMNRWRPYVGVSFGGIYGEGVNNTFTAGPEVGVKYYADNNTFVFVQTEYQFTFQDSDEITDAFNDGGYFHAVGIGFNF
ncbi:MAG: hypothetical protein VR70_17135 [Rhodospirillaceae bacterium BRH_c57]|nr:MAG: hypothetical protein VR70_17135 [Rhodospirillaceae bacterium BRH_c57]